MKILILAAFSGYLLSALLFMLKQKVPSIILVIASGALCWVHFVFEWQTTGQPPLGNMYNVLVFLGACALPTYAALVFGRKLTWMSPVIAIAGALPLAATFMPNSSLQRDAAWHLAPALQSPWFIPHVAAYMISYMLCLIAVILKIIDSVKSSDTKQLANGSHEVLTLAFPLMTFGMLSGALWANSIWGRYWSWDPKETWALITWSLYLAYFHSRKSSVFKQYSTILHYLAFFALFATFFFVNLLPKLASKLHSYV